MKKFHENLRLVFFFGLAFILYMYTASILSSQHTEFKNIIELTPNQAYGIWNQINMLEKLWFAKRTGKAQPIALSKPTITKLSKLTASYEELFLLVRLLIQARLKNDLSEFADQKEKIAEILRPIWHTEMQRRTTIGWFGRIKEDVSEITSRIYNYLFPSKQPVRVKYVGRVNESGNYVTEAVPVD